MRWRRAGWRRASAKGTSGSMSSSSACWRRLAEGEGDVDYKLEVVVVPVSDVDRAKAFYADQVGFAVDVDHSPNDHFRVVQLTPPGSGCSITIGKGLTDHMEPGSIKGLQL